MSASGSWDAATYEEGSSLQTAEALGLLRRVGPVEGRSVIDVGCGDGRLVLALMEAGARVAGVDPSLSMVRRAHARGVVAVVGRAEALPLSAGACDVVLSNAALHWCSDHDAVMRELVRILAPGGAMRIRLGGPGNQWGTFLEAERLFTEAPFASHRPAGFRASLQMAEPTHWFTALTDLSMEVERVAVEMVDPAWPDPDAMARWFLPIAHPYTERLPEDLRPLFVAEVVGRAWERPRAERSFVRVAIDASKGR